MRRSATARIRSVETTQIPPQQIDEDLKFLARYTDCIRTYSVENGLDKVPEIAQRHGLKVLQGLWLSNKARAQPGANGHHRGARQKVSRTSSAR